MRLSVTVLAVLLGIFVGQQAFAQPVKRDVVEVASAPVITPGIVAAPSVSSTLPIASGAPAEEIQENNKRRVASLVSHYIDTLEAPAKAQLLIQQQQEQALAQAAAARARAEAANQQALAAAEANRLKVQADLQRLHEINMAKAQELANRTPLPPVVARPLVAQPVVAQPAPIVAHAPNTVAQPAVVIIDRGAQAVTAQPIAVVQANNQQKELLQKISEQNAEAERLRQSILEKAEAERQKTQEEMARLQAQNRAALAEIQAKVQAQLEKVQNAVQTTAATVEMAAQPETTTIRVELEEPISTTMRVAVEPIAENVVRAEIVEPQRPVVEHTDEIIQATTEIAIVVPSIEEQLKIQLSEQEKKIRIRQEALIKSAEQQAEAARLAIEKVREENQRRLDEFRSNNKEYFGRVEQLATTPAVALVENAEVGPVEVTTRVSVAIPTLDESLKTKIDEERQRAEAQENHLKSQRDQLLEQARQQREQAIQEIAKLQAEFSSRFAELEAKNRATLEKTKAIQSANIREAELKTKGDFSVAASKAVTTIQA